MFQNYENGVLVKFAADTMRASDFYTLASKLDPVRQKQMERDLALERRLVLNCGTDDLKITKPVYEPLNLD